MGDAGGVGWGRFLPLLLRHCAGSSACRSGSDIIEVESDPTRVTRPHPGEAAAAMGRKGGKSTAKRGKDYFRKIAAMRKSFKGGRPPKGAK